MGRMWAHTHPKICIERDSRVVLLASTQLDTHRRAPAPTLPRRPRTTARSYSTLQNILAHRLSCTRGRTGVFRQATVATRTKTHVRTHTADEMGFVTSIFCFLFGHAHECLCHPLSLTMDTAGGGQQTAGPAAAKAAAATKTQKGTHTCPNHMTQNNLAQTHETDQPHSNTSSMPAVARTRARRPRAARARTATPRCRHGVARPPHGPVPPGTSRGCARRIARVARGSALR